MSKLSEAMKADAAAHEQAVLEQQRQAIVQLESELIEQKRVNERLAAGGDSGS
jgi:hypothetical protein